MSLPDFDIADSLKKVPMNVPLEGPDMILEMIKGNRIAIDLCINKKVTQAFIEADPKVGAIVAYDLNEKVINLVQADEKKVSKKNSPMIKSSKKPRRGKSL